MPSKELLQHFTYQTRLRLETSEDEALQDCAQLLSKVERDLFAALSSGKNAADLKSPFQKKYGVTGRHFNAVRVLLEGKIASIKEKQSGQIVEIKQRLTSLQSRIKKLEKSAPHSEKCHQKKRLLFNLTCKLNKLCADQEKGRVPLCFGSRRLFQAQFHLEANGYKNHDHWLSDWKQTRNNHFFLIGSKDEAGGNQSCTATLSKDSSLTLRIRLPNSLSEKHGKYLMLSGIYFQYGHQNIVAALKSCEERKDPRAQSCGVPISYRFKRDRKGWRLFVSTPVERSRQTRSSNQGVIGVDINANHLALSETDRFGNPLAKKSIPLNTYGKNRNQAKAVIGDTCAHLIDYAKKKGKPLVIENLDFQKKRAELKEQSPSYARMLSGLAYAQIKSHLKARAWREGVEIIEVNPAFTSLIGRVKFSRRYGLSIHQAAALAIGRRHLKVSERVPRHLDKIPDGKEGYVALSLPVRNRDKHVWSIWRTLNGELKTVLAAHFRARKTRSLSSKTCSCDNTIPDFVGEAPTRESVNTTARLASLDDLQTLSV
jgi:IS605 OrfB family transposase